MRARLEDEHEIALKDFLRILTEARLLPVYAVIVVNMFLVSILFGSLPVYLHSIGYTAPQSGSVVSVATLSYLLVQPLAGHGHHCRLMVVWRNCPRPDCP
jgi:cyanate permease